MARPMASSAKRPRISIDVQPEVRRRLRLAAAQRDLTVRQYVLEALEERLHADLADGDAPFAFSGKTDPALADVWDSRRDAGHGRVHARRRAAGRARPRR